MTASNGKAMLDFSTHAKEQMTARGISPAEVLSVITSPYKVQHQRDWVVNVWRVMPSDQGQNRTIRVTYDRQTRTVITVAVVGQTPNFLGAEGAVDENG